MKISGFTFVKNATRLYIPVKESIMSALPLVDEFIVALGDNHPDDNTLKEIESIGSDKIKIVHTVWDVANYPKGTVFARETDIAKEHCSGDWLLYIQADEALHEDGHQAIREAFAKHLDNPKVEGFIFRFKHFWGDFDHYHYTHNWYPWEIRAIRNLPQIHSWRDAQSFRKFDSFDYSAEDYLRKENTQKLNVIKLEANMFHYGYARPPHLMMVKSRSNSESYWGKKKTEQMFKGQTDIFEYGPLNLAQKFKGTHPATMKEWIKKLDWKDQLQYSGPVKKGRPKQKHERMKYRLLAFIEQKILGGRTIGGFKNYKIVS